MVTGFRPPPSEDFDCFASYSILIAVLYYLVTHLTMRPGHTYYYNATTKQSTYQRPIEIAPIPPPPPTNAAQSFLQYQNVARGPQLGGPGFVPYGPNGMPMNQPYGAPGPHQPFNAGTQHPSRQQQPPRPKPQPTDKPRTKRPIPGHENWFLIETKLQRRFVYNSAKNESYWRIPEKLTQPILEMDQQRIKDKAESLAKEQAAQKAGEGATNGPGERPGMEEKKGEEQQRERLEVPEGEDSDEYEEVEVTDDEGAEEEARQEAKRQRLEMEQMQEERPVEFTEEDIAYQLAQLGQEYGLDEDEYGAEDYPEEEFSEEDAVALFKDLLNDSGISPFMDWDRVVEEGKLVFDSRYTSLSTMKRRKEVWDEWTVEKIRALKEQRAKEERKDPRIPFLAYLQKNANPKLYWPEFRRKFRKDQEMKAQELSDKEREKMYREHVARLKLPQSTLKSDFLNLLKAQPIGVLNNKTSMNALPSQLLSDIKFYSLDEKVRDKLMEDYISTLRTPPEVVEEEESEEVKKERAERQRREKALADREKRVAEEKRRQERNLALGKGRMREEEEQIERALRIGKGGLRGHLMSMDVDEKTKEGEGGKKQE